MLVGLRPGVYILSIGGDRLRVDHVFCGRRRRFSCHVCCGEKKRCWRHNAAEKRETNIPSTSKYLCWSLNSLHFAWLCTGNGFLLYIPFIVVILKYFFVNGYLHCVSANHLIHPLGQRFCDRVKDVAAWAMGERNKSMELFHYLIFVVLQFLAKLE